MCAPIRMISLGFIVIIFFGVSGEDKFRINLVSLGDCDLPPEAYDQQDYVDHFMLAYKLDRQRTRVKANYTITHNTGPVITSVRSYELRGSTQQKGPFSLTNLSCTDMFVSTFVNMLKVNYTEDCYALPGTYTFDDFDAQKLETFMVFIWQFGRYAHDIEFRTPRGVITCIHAVVDVTKNKFVPKAPRKNATRP